MGCTQSSKVVEWSDEVKEAITEIEGWDNVKALEAAKTAANAGADKDEVMKAAEEAKEAPEEGEPAAEEGDAAEKTAEAPEAAVEVEEATPAEE